MSEGALGDTPAFAPSARTGDDPVTPHRASFDFTLLPLDFTLPPNQVRVLGQQITELKKASPAAADGAAQPESPELAKLTAERKELVRA